MADNNSTVQFKADISQLKSAMQQAQRQVRLASSEFKAASAGLDDWSSSAVGLNAKVKQLKTTLEAQRKQVELANEEYEKTVKVYGKNSAEADRAKMKLNGYEAAVAKTEKELKNYESELKDCENGTGRFADSTEDLEDATQRASDGFTVMKGALANLVADGFRMAIDAAKEFAKETLQAGMNFEQGMAQVQAVSGASGEELEALTEKAKEMGAKTKFSATESAEAFNYMAMAGWKTEDMINGIEGIMNLAAASGADLATTSDIVTDALTAMGYSAGDAGKLADVMAAASSNANTNVEMMGQTFQYAAPIVGALGYNMEDTAVQIGLMANAGIKGEKAGTALRSILTRLSAPPSECAKAMEELGISLTDSEGNMKSLDEVMGDLRKAFAGLDETQQTANAKAIAGQEAMSGLLAIVNAAPADYQKLTQAVKESEGAAESMADTMNDTVEGQLTLLKSQIEGVQIQIYERLTPALRDGIDKISETIDAINWDEVGDKLGDFANKAIDLFIKIIDNSEGIISVLKSVGTVLGATFVVSKVMTFAQAIVGLYTTFKALKTATDVATTSQRLLNAAQAATPIGLVTAAVAGLTAGIIYLASKNNEAAESTQILTEYEEEQINKINEMREAYQELQSARDENVTAINNEYGYYQELATELDSLVDANGQVKAGYEDRANFILTTLNEAVGTEMELVDGVIQNYQDEKKAIDELIQSKKAEAILRANEELYTSAIQNRDEALKNLTSAQGMYKQNMAEMKNAEKAYNDIMSMTTAEYAKANDLTWDMGTASQMLANDQEALKQKFIEAKAAVGESRVAMGNAQSTYDGYMSTIQNYEGLSSAIISGDAEKISKALTNMEYDFQTAETATKESLEQQVKNYEENLEALKQAIENGTPGVTQEMVDQAEAMVKKANEELDKAPDDFAERANKAAKNYASNLGSDSNKKLVLGSANSLRTEANKGVEPDSNEKTAGKNFGLGYAQAILEQGPTVNQNAKSLGSGAVSSLNEGQESQSPSKATYRSGEYFGQGFINGMESKKNSIWEKAKSLAKKAIEALRKGQEEGSPSKLTYQSGIYFVQGYVNGIVSQQGKLQKTVKGMVKTVITELAKMSNYNFSEVGANASEAYGNAFTKKLDYTINRMTYNNEKKLAEFDKSVSKLEAQRDKASSELEKQSAKRIKALEKERDNQIKDIEDQRDNKIASLEKERDKKVKALQSQIDSLGSKKENAARKKELQTQLKQVKENATKQIKAAKTNATKLLSTTKSNATKQINAEKEANKKQIASSDKSYKKLIDAENKKKEAYQTASEQMLSEYSTAMNEYQTKAQALIDNTINGITDKYNERYDELIAKQDNLIDKLKSAGDLFEVSGAGIMTVNDLKEQTKAINEYTSKLQKIKGKVSSELFDQIASYDIKEGSAFMDRLLAMSASDLNAYNKAYTEKMEAAQKAGENIYKADFDKITKDYNTEINKAFKDLPKQLEELGNQAMKGFLSGLTTNTNYMDKQVKTYVKAMVNSFKKELKIKSPSRVMMEIGDYTGEGLIDGLKGTINSVKKVANEMAQSVATPLDGMKTDIGAMKASVGNSQGLATHNNSVINNYNLVQNNNSPKSLSALETYRARRQQIAMVKAMT